MKPFIKKLLCGLVDDFPSILIAAFSLAILIMVYIMVTDPPQKVKFNPEHHVQTLKP